MEFEGVSKDVYKRCQYSSTYLVLNVWKWKVIQKMRIKDGKTLPQIHFKMLGNWRCL
jgi:hypothetical protein